MRALILGGSGFIGSRVARALLDAGGDPAIFARGNRADGLPTHVLRLRGDRGSETDLAAAIRSHPCDVIIDLLCYSEDDADRLVRVMRGARTRRLVHVSTCSVYWCTGDFPCPVPEEDFDRLGDFDERPGSIEYAYGYAKRKAESRLMRAHRDGEIEVTIVRPPCVAGEGDPTLRYASYCARVKDGGPVVLPDGGFTPFRHVYVGDLAQAIAQIPARQGSAGRAYNLASPEILSVRRLAEDVAALLSCRPEWVEIPVPVIRAFSGNAPDAIAFSPFSQRAPQVPDVARAGLELGWAPTPYPRWLEITVRWWRDVGAASAGVPSAMRQREREMEWVRAWRTRVSSA